MANGGYYMDFERSVAAARIIYKPPFNVRIRYLGPIELTIDSESTSVRLIEFLEPVGSNIHCDQKMTRVIVEDIATDSRLPDIAVCGVCYHAIQWPPSS